MSNLKRTEILNKQRHLKKRKLRLEIRKLHTKIEELSAKGIITGAAHLESKRRKLISQLKLLVSESVDEKFE